MFEICLQRLSRFCRCVTYFALAILASCASTAPTTTSVPGDGEDEMIMGGPPWVFPPGEVAAIPPDIAIPLEGLAGTWTGGRLGSALSGEARQKMIDLTQLSLSRTPAGEKVSWRDGKIAGTVTPQVRFVGPANLTCREFHQVLRADGKVETGYATACQAPDGSWRLLSE